MHPRTVVLVVGLILLTSFGLRILIFQTGILPVSEELVMRQAVSLTVTYAVGGQAKTLTVDRPEALEDLFAVFRLRQREAHRDVVWRGGPVGQVPVGGAVKFHFPDHTARQLQFLSRDWLGEFEVDPRFYQRLCDLVSRAEGRRIDLLDDNQGGGRGP